MMPRRFEVEMSRFEAEISGGIRPQMGHQPFMSGGARVPAPHGIFRAPVPVMMSAPAVISAPPSRAKNADDDDILATLEKYEKEAKIESKKSTSLSALPKDVAHKKAKLMAEQVKKSATTTSTASSSSSSSSSTAAGSGGGLPAGVKAPASATMSDEAVKKAKLKKRMVRTGGGQVWEDETLKEWEANDFRIFCGDLGNDVTDEVLARTFGRYPSFLKAKVVRDKRSNKTRGFGFVSFRDPADFTKAMKEMNGKYVGSRPIKLRKSNWKDRNIEVVRQKQKDKQRMGYKW